MVKLMDLWIHFEEVVPEVQAVFETLSSQKGVIMMNQMMRKHIQIIQNY